MFYNIGSGGGVTSIHHFTNRNTNVMIAIILTIVLILGFLIFTNRKPAQTSYTEDDFTETLRFISKYERVDSTQLQQLLQLGNTDVNEERAIRRILRTRNVREVGVPLL